MKMPKTLAVGLISAVISAVVSVSAMAADPAGETVTMAPGGYHIMMMDVEESIQVGSTVPLTLTFETFGNVAIDASVSMTPPSSPDAAPVENMGESMGDHQGMMHGGH